MKEQGKNFDLRNKIKTIQNVIDGITINENATLLYRQLKSISEVIYVNKINILQMSADNCLVG